MQIKIKVIENEDLQKSVAQDLNNTNEIPIEELLKDETNERKDSTDNNKHSEEDSTKV